MSKLMDEGKDNPGPANNKVFALFQNLENQGAALTFAWQGKILTFADGQVYQMNREQIDHLNSLTYNTYRNEEQPDGQIKSVPASKRHRFSVREVSSGEVAKIRAEMEQPPA